MRIAVTYDYDSKQVFQHFGQTQHFLLVDVLDNGELASMVVDNGGFSHGELVDYLSHLEVNVVICGGLGNRAIELMTNANMKVIPGISGDALTAVKKYQSGELKGDMSVLHNCDCKH
jgi:predicted Fe-Mo cluster-binding NifX family protein